MHTWLDKNIDPVHRMQPQTYNLHNTPLKAVTITQDYSRLHLRLRSPHCKFSATYYAADDFY